MVIVSKIVHQNVYYCQDDVQKINIEFKNYIRLYKKDN